MNRQPNGSTAPRRFAPLVRSLAFAGLFGGLAAPAAALTVGEQDCREGSDFIANAARARDAGMPAERFKARLEEDLVLIQAYPPALRWFAQDDEDAQILRVWVSRTFDATTEPLRLQSMFLESCLEQAAVVQARRERRGPAEGAISAKR